MICDKCGMQLNKNTKFCQNCGNEIKVQTFISNKKTCRVCGNELGRDSRFCKVCGTKSENTAKMIMTCSGCGSQINPGTMFCSKCGTPCNKTKKMTESVVVTEKNKSKDNKGIIIFLSVLAVLFFSVAAVFGIMYFKNTDSETSSDRKSSEKKSVELVKETDDEEDKASESEPFEESSSQTEESEYLFPSDTELITREILDTLTKEEIAFVRNEIFARHGYVFVTEPYKSYFKEKDWYYENEYFDESLFNYIEKANKDIIVEYEIEKGWR